MTEYALVLLRYSEGRVLSGPQMLGEVRDPKLVDRALEEFELARRTEADALHAARRSGNATTDENGLVIELRKRGTE